MLRRVPYLLLAVFWAAGYAVCAQKVPVGTIVNAVAAQVGSTPASTGTTVFDGDHFLTGADGLLLIQSGPAQLYLGGSSAATLRSAANGVDAVLDAGVLAASTSRAAALRVILGGALLHAVDDAPSHVQAAFVGPGEFLITVKRGSWELTYQCGEETLAEGSSFRLVLDPSRPCPGPQRPPQESAKGGHMKKAYLLIPIPAIALGIYWGLHHKPQESPSRP